MFALPTRGLVLVGLFAICVLLSEGAVGDWAAIYLSDEIGTGEGTAAAGLAAFSLTMAIGRLAGDRLNQRFGAVSLARAGGSLAAFGMGAALLADGAGPALAGFALAGLGLSALFPLALRAAAAQGASAGTAVAAVSAMGYTGFLAGPPAIGGLAELVGLRAALVLVVACSALAAALAGRVRAPAAATAR
jgi:MFS family permease